MKVKKIAKETGNVENRTCAKVTHAGRNLTGRLSKTKHADNNDKQDTHRKLYSVSPTRRFRR